MKAFASVLLFFVSAKMFSQNVVSGIVQNQQKEILLKANVLISNHRQHQIIAYAITNSRGEYEIKCSDLLDSLEIKVTMIGYATQTKVIVNKSQITNFTLAEKSTELPMVTVKTKPITVTGDTTNYNVASFSSKQDRVIGDVIAKLPGIEIDANGQIKYNGQFISNYYIEGLDLLESRYNIANQNIPISIVDQVQILNNHQPIKMLDSINVSTTPALNIKLKNSAKNKLIGKVKLGVGVAPMLWDNEMTALNFTPKNQLISSYKNNNSGATLGNELADNVGVRRVGDVADQNIKENILNNFTSAQPPIAANRYVFNNTHLAHLNMLMLFKNKAQLKLNVSYLNDQKTNEDYTNTIFYLQSDTFSVAEKKYSSTNTNQINGSLDYTINKTKVYLKNTTKAKFTYVREANEIVNSSKIIQTLTDPFYQYSNDFALSFSRNKKVYSLSSSSNYNNMPQTLEVEPGQFTSIFNQATPYEAVIQNAALNNFNTNNSIAFSTKLGKVKQQIKMGGEYINKNIQTSIYKIYNQVKYQLNDSFQNKLNWQNTRLYAEARSTLSKGKVQLEIGIPIELNSLYVRKLGNGLKEHSTNIFFNPVFNLDIPIMRNLQAQFGYNRTNSIGSPIQIMQGYVLNSYRNISQNDSLVSKQKQNIYSFSLFYKNPLNALFGYVTTTYVVTNRNLINTQSYDTFYNKTVALRYPNVQNSFSLTGNISQYLISDRTNISLGYNYNYIQTPQYLQSNLVNLHYSVNKFQLKISYAKLKWLNIETNTAYDISKNKIKTTSSVNSASSFYKIQQELKLHFYPSKNLTIFLNNYFYNVSDRKVNNNNYFFCDTGVKFKLKKSDLELTCTNITDTKSYTSLFISNNQLQTITQNVRPVNFILRYQFNF